MKGDILEKLNDSKEVLIRNRHSVEALNRFYVYALWFEDKIVYVGKTTSLYARIKIHLKDKRFDEFSYTELDSGEEIEFVESNLIYKLDPKYNKTIQGAFTSIRKLRVMIQKLSKRHKSDSRYYVNRIRENLVSNGIELYSYKGIEHVKNEDVERSLSFILEGD